LHAYMDVGSRAKQEQLPRRSFVAALLVLLTLVACKQPPTGVGNNWRVVYLEGLAVTQRETYTNFIFLIHLTTLGI